MKIGKKILTKLIAIALITAMVFTFAIPALASMPAPNQDVLDKLAELLERYKDDPRVVEALADAEAWLEDNPLSPTEAEAVIEAITNANAAVELQDGVPLSALTPVDIAHIMVYVYEALDIVGELPAALGAIVGAELAALLESAGVPVNPRFSDVPGNRWYFTYVQWAYAAGVTQGFAGTTEFRPGGNATRQQFAAFLHRLDGSPSANPNVLVPFLDSNRVAGWAIDAVSWAVAEGIIEGRNNNLQPTANISRAEAVVMLHRYADGAGTAGDATTLAGFADAGAVPTWAQAAMRWAVASDIVEGRRVGGNLVLEPGSDITRAQTVAVLQRAFLVIGN